MQLINVAYVARTYLQNLFEREEGQDVFEYLLIIAGISVVIIAAGALAVPGLFDEVVYALCNAIDGISGLSVSCTDPSP